MKFGKLVGAMIASTVLLAGCTPGSGEAANDDEVTLTFSAWILTQPGRGEVFTSVINEFNSSHDGINIELLPTAYPDHHDKLHLQLGAGSGPDLFQIDIDQLYRAVQDGTVLDLNQYHLDDHNLSAINDFAVIDGKRYGVLLGANAYALIVNDELLAQAGVSVPETTDELIEAAARVSERVPGAYGFAFRQTLAEEAGWWLDMCNWVYGHGARWTSSTGDPSVLTDEMEAAFSAYKAMYESGAIPQGADAATYRRMAWEGKVAMMIDNEAVPPILIAGNPSIEAKLSVHRSPFPTDVGTGNAIMIGASASVDSKQKLDAIGTFYDWFLTDSVQEKLQAELGEAGVATTIEPSQDLVDKRPWLPLYNARVSSARITAPEGHEPETSEFRHIVLSNVERMLIDDEAPRSVLIRIDEELRARFK